MSLGGGAAEEEGKPAQGLEEAVFLQEVWSVALLQRGLRWEIRGVSFGFSDKEISGGPSQAI